MPARTYSTDVYLTCPCSECDGRQVRITLRKFQNLHGRPRQPATKPCTSSCREAMTRPGSKARWPDQWANTGRAWDPADRSGIPCMSVSTSPTASSPASTV
jgi:hypothetical protein